MSRTPPVEASDRVPVSFRATPNDRNWFKAAAALDGMNMDEWLFWLATRRAIEKAVPRPSDRAAFAAR